MRLRKGKTKKGEEYGPLALGYSGATTQESSRKERYRITSEKLYGYMTFLEQAPTILLGRQHKGELPFGALQKAKCARFCEK